jgi:hypothetical protein
MDAEKKNFLETLKANKETIIRRTLLVAGVVGGIAIATVIASAAAKQSDEAALEALEDSELVFLEPIDTPVES